MSSIARRSRGRGDPEPSDEVHEFALTCTNEDWQAQRPIFQAGYAGSIPVTRSRQSVQVSGLHTQAGDALSSLGETVTWRARHFGVPWTVTSKITALDRPSRFV